MKPLEYQEAIDNFISYPKEPGYNDKLHKLWNEITQREWDFW